MKMLYYLYPGSWLGYICIYRFVCMDPKSSNAEVVAPDTRADNERLVLLQNKSKLLSTKTEEEIITEVVESIENARRIAIAAKNAVEKSAKDVDEGMKRLNAELRALGYQ